MLHPFSGGAAIAAYLAMMMTPVMAAAQTGNCASHAMVVERLASKYGETRQSIGLGSDNTVMEVFASPRTGSWTITVTTARGLTCLVASGQAFEPVRDVLPESGDDA